MSCPRPRMEQTVSTVQDHKSWCLFEFLLTATLDFFQRSFGRFAWDLFRCRFFFCLNCFHPCAPFDLFASFCFHLLLSNWPTASPKSTSVLRPLVLVWQSEKKSHKMEKKEEKTLPQRTLACSRQAHDAKSRLHLLYWLTSISSSLILNLIVGSLIFHSEGCRRRSHDYHESPKSDFFVYYPRLRFISLVLLFYAWHLCLAVITHRVLPFFFSLPFHLGTLFPFATLYAVPDVNLFFFFNSHLKSSIIHSLFFFFFFFSFFRFLRFGFIFLWSNFLLQSMRSTIQGSFPTPLSRMIYFIAPTSLSSPVTQMANDWS